jgi:hypothetical protein
MITIYYNKQYALSQTMPMVVMASTHLAGKMALKLANNLRD